MTRSPQTWNVQLGSNGSRNLVMGDRKKLLPLQDLRGIAVLMVVLYHAGGVFRDQIFPYRFANIGVSLFFIISGFIVAHIHGRDAGLHDAIVFLKKRIARIYPAYFPVYFAFLLIINLAGKGAEYHRDIVNILRNFFLVQHPSLSIHPYSWSLVFEMFYYLLFAVLISLFPTRLLLFAFVMAVTAIFGSFLGPEHTEGSLWFSYYNIYFAFGIAFSIFWKYTTISISGVVPLLALLALLWCISMSANQHVAFALCAVFFSSYLLSRVSLPFLAYVGSASYSIYLVHALILPVVKPLAADQSYLFWPIIVASCLLAGVAYYHFVEQRLISAARRFLRA